MAWSDSNLEAAFRRKLPRWYDICNRSVPPGPDRSVLLREKTCPICRQVTVYCCRHDFGRVDTHPKFAHICVDKPCPYVIETDLQGVSWADIEGGRNYCPWCQECHP